MKLLWGDIHNHCGITYGYGSLENALERAKSQLDFCTITGHAMWPDMPNRTPETAFVVDFHKAGFSKLKQNWEQIRQTVAKANTDDFITFQGYEMHSSEYGDHHIVSLQDNLDLVYEDSPKALLEHAGAKALMVCHHIGYTPNYRGINWDKYNQDIVPLIEVFSKHGCGMSETAPYPYYHNMGPRDSRNTVYEGLKRGFRFGFVGSTDHHAGFPGSYGDGKMAVWAEEKSRESIFEAMLQRRTYAVTGDKIECDFFVNNAPMGSVLTSNDRPREISYQVKAWYPIDKIVVYKNLKPLRIVEGLLLEPSPADKRYCFRIEMGWGDNSDSLFQWEGSLSIENGEIIHTQPCWRGRSVLAPSSTDTHGFDYVNDMEDKIVEQTPNSVQWQCYTVKNISPLHPQTCSVIFEVEGNPDTQLHICVNGNSRTMSIGELLEYGYTQHTKPYHSQAFKVHRAVSESQYSVRGIFTDADCQQNDFYHMEVYQQNGSCAFVTPVYFE